MRAIILAAGQGTRLQPLTLSRPKCMVELGGIPLLDRQASVLKQAGVSDISVVVGYKAEVVAAKGYKTILNPDYEVTNMVETLFCASSLMQGDTDLIIGYGDIVYEPRVLQAVLECEAPVCLSIDREWRRFWSLRLENPLSDAETLKLDEHGFIRELGKKPKSYDEIQGQYMGLIKVRRDYVSRLAEVHRAMDPNALYDGKNYRNMYMTSFLQHLINLGWPVKAALVDNGWLEIDTVSDLDLYHQMMRNGELAAFYDASCVHAE